MTVVNQISAFPDHRRFAYADPPYIGQARKHYGDEEVNHPRLIEQLTAGGYAGWALSCSTPTLHYLLRLTPPETRIGAWVKPFCSFKPGVNPAYAWEPVLVWGGRPRGRDLPTLRDWHSENITLKKGMSGAKPVGFCRWLFQWWNVQSGDTLDDLFPGTGIVTETWESYVQEIRDA